jgi:hypothetical protein
MTKSKASAKDKKPVVLDADAFKAILEDNRREVVMRVYDVAVELAVQIKYGSGMINRGTVSESEISEVRDAMAPLVNVLRQEATMSFARVFEGMLETPSLRDYLRRTTAKNIGKEGGRRSRPRATHLVWLEEVMRTNHDVSGYNGLTAKEHLARIRQNPYIHIDPATSVMTLIIPGESDEFTIAESQINKTLTHIKKKPIST